MENRDEIIKKQDEYSAKFKKAQDEFIAAEEEFNSYFKQFETTEIEKLLGNECQTKTECTNKIVELLINKPAEYERINKQIEEYRIKNNIKPVDELINRYQKAKYNFYSEFVIYLNNIAADHEKYFSKTYKKRINALAEKGIFLYMEETRDLEPLLTDNVEENIKTVMDLYSQDDFGPLIYSLQEIIKDGLNSSNKLQKDKTEELTEAIATLVNGCYSSCARTMLALIENEHTNASNLFADYFENGIADGLKRSIKISEQLGSINIGYCSDAWVYINAFYKKITAKKEPGDNVFINRNDLVHGDYDRWKKPDKKDCFGLITLYISFKTISYILQKIEDIRLEVSRDVTIYLAQKYAKSIVKA